MSIIRYILVFLIIYLIIRSFFKYSSKEETKIRGPEKDEGRGYQNKGVSKEIGEYVDYEEIDK